MSIESSTHTESTEALRRQVHESRSTVVKAVLVLLGSLCVGLGVAGIVLPILPTTPFLLLAAICYSHSSERFYIWLLSNRYFGHYIRDWREKRGLSTPVKLWIIFVLIATMSLSIAFFIPFLSIKIACAITGLFITAYIWRLPTKTDTFVEENTD